MTKLNGITKPSLVTVTSSILSVTSFLESAIQKGVTKWFESSGNATRTKFPTCGPPSKFLVNFTIEVFQASRQKHHGKSRITSCSTVVCNPIEFLLSMADIDFWIWIFLQDSCESVRFDWTSGCWSDLLLMYAKSRPINKVQSYIEPIIPSELQLTDPENFLVQITLFSCGDLANGLTYYTWNSLKDEMNQIQL